MRNPSSPPVTPSAAAHAERIRSGEQRAEASKPVAGQSTAERIAARILPGYRADEELREQARLNELRARGVISAVDEEPDEDEDEALDEEEVDEDDDEEEAPSTAELYARRERQRQQAEHRATLAAHKSVGRAAVPQVGHNYAAQLAQPYRRGNGWGSGPAA